MIAEFYLLILKNFQIRFSPSFISLVTTVAMLYVCVCVFWCV